MYSDFCLTISLLQFEEFRFTFQFRSDSVRSHSQQSWFAPTEIPGMSAELCDWYLIFEIIREADQFVTTHSQDHHRYPCCIFVLLAVHD